MPSLTAVVVKISDSLSSVSLCTLQYVFVHFYVLEVSALIVYCMYTHPLLCLSKSVH